MERWPLWLLALSLASWEGFALEIGQDSASLCGEWGEQKGLKEPLEPLEPPFPGLAALVSAPRLLHLGVEGAAPPRTHRAQEQLQAAPLALCPA